MGLTRWLREILGYAFDGLRLRRVSGVPSSKQVFQWLKNMKYQTEEGPTVLVEDHQDLLNILDILHTQCIDNLPEDSIATTVLENAMEQLEHKYNITAE